MHYVSLIVEFVRGRPAVVFWTAALTQATLWTLMPALFYSAPPGEVPLLLAIGHEFVLGSYLGPPLSFWLGELAFRLGGAFGLYALAQACIVLTYWSVFMLGRRIVGTRHAVLAVLLLVGVSAFTVPSPDFGPAVLATPFWGLALLHYWRAVIERERGCWYLLAVDLGLLLLASYVGLILIALMAAFTLATARGRASLFHADPWIALLPFVIVIFPHLLWLSGRPRSRHLGPPRQERGDRHAAARPLALRRAGGDPSRPRRDGRVRRRLAEAAAARAADRAQSGRCCSDARSSISSR